jgi:hypothetical protein
MCEDVPVPAPTPVLHKGGVNPAVRSHSPVRPSSTRVNPHRVNPRSFLNENDSHLRLGLMGAMELGGLVLVGLVCCFILGFVYSLESLFSLYGSPL